MVDALTPVCAFDGNNVNNGGPGIKLGIFWVQAARVSKKQV